MAAALAIRSRQLGLRALVITVDPAKRLATAMGLDLTGVEERIVPRLSAGDRSTGVLSAAIVDSKKTFDDFVVRYSTDPELFRRLSKNRLYQQLSTTLAGSQEFTALERLLQAVEAEENGRPKYDLVILDTPPTQHAIDFLSAPERIRNLFQDSITKWFMNPAEANFIGGQLLGSLLGRGTRVALKSLEVLTGGRFIDELIDFFHSVQSIQKTLRERTERINEILMSKASTFILVTSFDAAKLLEAQHLSGHLERFGYRLGGCVLNRAFPESLPDLASLQNQIPADLQESARRLVAFHARVRADHEARFALFQEFEDRIDTSVTVVQVPEYREDLFGLEDLEALARFLGQVK